MFSNDGIFAKIVNATPDLVAITRMSDGLITYVNQAYSDLSGYDPDEIIGKTTLELNFWTDPRLRDVMLEEIKQQGKVSEIELDHRTRSGQILPLSMSFSSIEIDGTSYLITIGRDIRKRRRTETALRQANTIVERSPVILFRWRAIDGWPVELVSDNVTRLGYTPAELTSGKIPFSSLVHPADLDRVVGEIREHLAAGLNDFQQEYRLVSKEGDIHWFDDRTTVERDANGDVTHFVGVMIDITERKRAEAVVRESERKFRGILEANSDGIVIVNSAGTIEEINPALEKLTGYTASELIAHPIDLLIPRRFGHHAAYFKRYVAKPTSRLMGPHRDLFVERKDGSEFPAEIGLSPLKTGRGLCISASIRDISERKRAEADLVKLSRAVESSSSSVVITDADGTIEYVNPKFTEHTGYGKKEVTGKNPRFLKSDETPDSVYGDMWRTISAGREWQGELYNRRKDGTYYWNRVSISGVKNNAGVISHYICIQDDVTERYELSRQLSHQAAHDALTGLANRREFERRAELLLSTTPRQHALCYVDLDQFKVVNDTCGHTAGDELLRQLAMVFERTVRKNDMLARLGGDEFGVLMRNCSLADAQRVASSLQRAVQNYQFVWQGRCFRVGASVGLVAINESTPDLSELLREADAACFMAKDLGRNRIHVYSPEDKDLARRHGEMQWVPRIQQALEDDRFCIYAQLISPVKTDNYPRYELLIRMIGDDGQILPPGAFMPSAERYNLSGQLDRWLIDNAFRLLTDNTVFLNAIDFVSLNISGQSLTEPGFLAFILSRLAGSGIDAGKLCFEITETTAISNLSAATKFISTLREIGCRFALDDFGSGLSSFGYLKSLPVDNLKIDGMFVRNIANDPIDEAMVKSINETGHMLGMQTTAEFVENDAVRKRLSIIGVDYVQGFGIEAPQPFAEVLRENNACQRGLLDG